MMNNVERNDFRPMPVIDGHLHMLRPDEMELIVQSVENIMEYYQYSRVNLCALVQESKEKVDPFNNARCFYIKDRMNTPENPNRVYVFGNIWHWCDERDTAEGYLKQVQDLMAMGADGIKLLDGKPDHRKMTGRPIDDPIFDLMYAYLEENQIPIISHIGDPAKDWDINLVGEYNLKHGRYYDETFPSLQQLRDETEGLLKKFPKLKLILAHFFFWGEEPQKVKARLDRYENVMMDTTPGGEMFVGFTNHPQESRALFEAYADRIVYGADTYNYYFENLEDYEEFVLCGYRINQCRRMLEKSEPFEDKIFGKLQPMHLPQEVLEKIYYKNFLRVVGDPRPVDPALVAEELRADVKAYQDGLKPVLPERWRELMLSNTRQMLRYFCNK